MLKMTFVEKNMESHVASVLTLRGIYIMTFPLPFWNNS